MLRGAASHPDPRQTHSPTGQQGQTPEANHEGLEIKKARSGEDGTETVKERGKLLRRTSG